LLEVDHLTDRLSVGQHLEADIEGFLYVCLCGRDTDPTALTNMLFQAREREGESANEELSKIDLAPAVIA
jgi:hypothetical protein